MLESSRAVAAIEAIFRECFRSFAALPGGALIDSAQRFGVVNDIAHPFFNGIGFSGFDGDVDAAVEDTIGIYRSRERPFRWWISPSTRPGDLDRVLGRHGFRHVYNSEGMAADLSLVSLESLPAKGLEIRTVEDERALREWAEILLGVFARPADETPLWIRAYTHLGLGRGPWRHYVGYTEETPVATASVLVSGALAGVYHVATLREWRGRGFGAALTLETMRHAANAGAKEIVLQSSELGAGVYRSLGFDKYCDLTLYDWSITR